jgi:hypothetical protein
MSDEKKPKYHKLIDGYETTLGTEGTHEIMGKTYHFGSITAKECEELITKGSQYVRASAPKPKANKPRGDEAEQAPNEN